MTAWLLSWLSWLGLASPHVSEALLTDYLRDELRQGWTDAPRWKLPKERAE
jgi:hypothetical protein